MQEKVNAKLQKHKDRLSVIHINCGSIRAHLDQVKELLMNLESKVEAICMSETWLTDTNCDLFSIPSYSSYCSNRQNKRGRGSAMYVKQ